jgi:glycosyltransferase involved in cell wall biosynthesis
MMIVHFSTVHYRDDSRIRSKMMKSLSARYHGQVKLFVQDGMGSEVDSKSGYVVVGTGPRLPRLKRMLIGGWRMFRAVAHERPTIAHFHDPELIPWAILLRLYGVRVVYDVHEDYPQSVAEYQSLPLIARRVLPSVIWLIEFASSLFFSGIVTVTPKIQARFPRNKTVLVRNFPVIEEFYAPSTSPGHLRPCEVAYIGTITQNRNIIGMLDAIGSIHDIGVSLRLAGDFPVLDDENSARSHPGWSKVRFDGWVSRDGIAGILASARAGLVVLKPIEHEVLSLPIKLFEYMAAGVPLIASDFPLWRSIIEDAECGLLVDPLNPSEIASAIRWVVNHPDEAQAMGLRGRQAALTKYNWNSEIDVLFHLYESITPDLKNVV